MSRDPVIPMLSYLSPQQVHAAARYVARRTVAVHGRDAAPAVFWELVDVLGLVPETPAAPRSTFTRKHS